MIRSYVIRVTILIYYVIESFKYEELNTTNVLLGRGYTRSGFLL